MQFEQGMHFVGGENAALGRVHEYFWKNVSIMRKNDLEGDMWISLSCQLFFFMKKNKIVCIGAIVREYVWSWQNTKKKGKKVLIPFIWGGRLEKMLDIHEASCLFGYCHFYLIYPLN